MLNPYAALLSVLLSAFQAAAIDGTWELVRIFRSGPAAAARAVPIDSTVYVRLTLETMPGGWIHGRLYRRYYGEEERPKVEAGPLRGTRRYIIGADFEHPAAAKARSAAWLVGDTLLHLGTPFVPDADSIELKRVGPDTPYPATVFEVVTRP
ncbi:MAG: hypothetical protein ACREMM_11100 [Gemmatimonadales bacterium]